MDTSLALSLLTVIMVILFGTARSDVIDVNELDASHFDHVIMTYMRERHIPGTSVAVSVGGNFLVRKGFGKASPHQMASPWSLFRLGSVSKVITAMGVLRLHEEGRLDLEDTVFGPTGWLRRFELAPGHDTRLYDVTIMDLLRHTAGWDHSLTGDPLLRRNLGVLLNRAGLPDRGDIIRYVLTQPLQHHPGTTFGYSNFGYLVLGRVIEQVTDLRYSTYIRGLLWSVGIYRMKLGNTSKSMADDFEVEYYSEYPTDRVQSIYPGEGLVSPPYGAFCLENMDSTSGWLGSAAEVVKLYDALNGTGKDGLRLLKPETFQLMVSEANVSNSVPGRVWYGTGLVVQDDGRTFWHSGHLEGSTALASRDESGITWAILANYKVRNKDLSDVMRYAIYRFQRQVEEFEGANDTNSLYADDVEHNHLAEHVHAISRNANNVVKLLIPEYKIKQTIISLSFKGYKLTWIDATEYFGIVYFNTIWGKDKRTKWKAYINLSPARYRRRFKAKLAQGYRLAFIETYTHRRRLRYAAIFVRDGWPPWVTYHGYSPHRHSEMFYRYLDEGYHLTVQSVTEYRDKVYVAAIYEKIFLGDIRVRMGLTGADLAEELSSQAEHGRILSYVQAYERLGATRFSAIWIPQTTEAWAVSDSMSKYTLLYKLQQYADVNVPLACVTSYVQGDDLKFAALWL